MSYSDSFKELQSISEYIEKVEDRFVKRISKLDFENEKIFKNFIESLSYKDGVVDIQQQYLKELLKLRKALLKEYSAPYVEDIIEEYIKEIPNILYQHSTSIAKINDLKAGNISNKNLIEFYTENFTTNFSKDVYAKDLVQSQINGFRKLLSRKTTLSKLRTDLEKGGGRMAQYSKQIVLDTNRVMIGDANETIKNAYNLDGFIYEGGLVKHSRPLCILLVGLKRVIGIEEIPLFLKKEENNDGLIDGTNKNNFVQRVAGYGCRHHATPVRLTNDDKVKINKYWKKELYKIIT